MHSVNSSFCCLGHEAKKHEFHCDSFLKSGIYSCVESGNDGNITLFGNTYTFYDALPLRMEEMFSNCRKYLWLLFKDACGNGTARSYVKLRQETGLFLNYIYAFLRKFADKCDAGESFFDLLEEQLWYLRLLFQKFTFVSLPSFALNRYPSFRGNDCRDDLYNLVHCHLDARWLFINIIQELQNHKEQSMLGTQFNASSFKLIVEEEVIRLISELISLAVVRFENAERAELGKTEIYYCTCLKELWILLMHFSYRKEDFWAYLNQCIRTFLENSGGCEEDDDLDLSPLKYPPCGNRREFLIWFCSGIAKLQHYDKQGNYLGVTYKENPVTLEIVDDVVKNILVDGDGPCEASMRTLLPLLHRIHRVWGHTMCGSLVYLWDHYFHGRINSAFYISGSNLNSTIVVSKSGLALLEQVKKRLDVTRRDKSENSFFMFLSLLGEYLSTARRSGASVKRFCGRVFVKFCGRTQKLEELTDIGVFHLASLYLTLALGSGDHSIVLNLLRTLVATLSKDIREGKHGMIWKSVAASILALQEMHGDVSGAAEIILGQITPAAPISHLVDALRVIFEGEPINVKGLSLFIDTWMAGRYPNYTDGSSEHLMSIFVPLLRNIKEPLRAGNKEAQTLLSKSEDIIRPLLTTRPSRKSAEVAALFTVLSNRRMDIYQYWSEHKECDLSGVYLCSLLDTGPDVVAAHLPQAPNKAVQVWVRCMFAYGPTEENKRFSRALMTLPEQRQLFQGWTHEDPLLNFFVSYGAASTVNANNLSVRQTFLAHFKGFDSWLEKHTKQIELLPSQHLERLYQYTAALILNCPQFIYARCDATSLIAPLVDCVLLPRRIYDPEYSPPRSLTQAMSKYLPQFMRGLMQLVPESDPYIWRLFKDTITHYIARFDHLSVVNHPLTEFLQSVANIPRFTKVFRLFFEVKDGNPHRNSLHALRLLLHAAVDCDQDVGISLFDSTAESVIELMILLDEKHPARLKSFDYLSTLLIIDSNRDKMLSVLSASCKKHIAFNATAWFKMAINLTPICRSELKTLAAVVEEEVLAVEKKRGVVRDNALRSHLDTLKRYLKPQLS